MHISLVEAHHNDRVIDLRNYKSDRELGGDLFNKVPLHDKLNLLGQLFVANSDVGILDMNMHTLVYDDIYKDKLRGCFASHVYAMENNTKEIGISYWQPWDPFMEGMDIINHFLFENENTMPNYFNEHQEEWGNPHGPYIFHCSFPFKTYYDSLNFETLTMERLGVYLIDVSNRVKRAFHKG